MPNSAETETAGRAKATSVEKPKARHWDNWLLVAASIAVTLLAIELGFRAVNGQPVFSLTNFRTERVVEG